MSVSEQTILLVEDNSDDIELAMHGFHQIHSRCRLDIVKDGENALDYLFGTGSHAHRKHSRPPDLILLDLKLPGISGLEVLKRIRQSSLSKRIPVVILSTSDEESDIVESYNLGVNSYLCKPVEFGNFSYLLELLGLYWLDINVSPPH